MMETDECEEILHALLADLAKCLGDKKASTAAKKAQCAYMEAARKYRDLRARKNNAPLAGSAHHD